MLVMLKYIFLCFKYANFVPLNSRSQIGIMNELLKKIKKNKKLKQIIHWLIIIPNEARPRLWVSLLINPFFHSKGRGSKIRWKTRMDVIPFNNFKIGDFTIIEDFSTVNNGVGPVIIGQNTLLGINNVIIGPVTIGDNVIIAQNVVVSGLNHDYKDINVPIRYQPVSTSEIKIEDNCWIGANTVITAGVSIGKHCVIAAGSIVTKDIPSYSIAAGNPAKIIKKYNFEVNSWVKC